LAAPAMLCNTLVSEVDRSPEHVYEQQHDGFTRAKDTAPELMPPVYG